MLVLARALVYSAVFIGFLLVFLPARVLSSVGVGTPPGFGVPQAIGVALTAAGMVLAVDKFGEEYVTYCPRVSRWLPRARQVPTQNQPG